MSKPSFYGLVARKLKKKKFGGREKKKA